MLRIVVLISGSGTNLQALIDATASGQIDAEIVGVFSNRRDAYGLQRAARATIPTVYFPLKAYTSRGKPRSDYDAGLAQIVGAFSPDLVVLAGWMHILSPAFLDHFPQRVINLHPALPGEFSGTHAIERAYDACQRGEITRSGVMVHYAIPEVDAGAVITSCYVPLSADDTLRTFEARMHAVEHRLIVQAVGLIAREFAAQSPSQ